jgi:hypothetical protein
VAVALLLRRRKEAIEFGLAHGFSAPRIAQKISATVASGISEARVLSRVAGIESLAQEVEAVGGSFESVLASPAAGIPRDIRRARTFADNYAKRWLRKADEAASETVAKAARVANTETASSLKRIAVTESSEALNGGKDSAADEIRERTSLLKVWDAQLDKLTCPICGTADGTIVGIKESFPHGQPGAVHPWCRCTWQVLTFAEHGDEGLIEPKPPAKVISLPTKTK